MITLAQGVSQVPGPYGHRRALVCLPMPLCARPLWASPSPCRSGPCGPPWALVCLALVGLPGPLWAKPLYGFHGSCGLGPHGPGPNGHWSGGVTAHTGSNLPNWNAQMSPPEFNPGSPPLVHKYGMGCWSICGSSMYVCPIWALPVCNICVTTCGTHGGVTMQPHIAALWLRPTGGARTGPARVRPWTPTLARPHMAQGGTQ